MYLFGCNLYDIVVENTQSGSFGIEDNDVPFFINLEKTLHIRHGVGAEKVGRRQRANLQLMYKLPCRSMGFAYPEALHNPGPGQEIVFAAEHTGMCQQQFYFGCSKEIGARNLEMVAPDCRQRLTHAVGILIGIDDNGRCLVSKLFVKTLCMLGYIVVFGHDIGRSHKFVIVFTPFFGIVGGLWQQRFVSPQLLYGIRVEQVNEQPRRPVVDAQMVYTACTTPLKHFQCGHFRPHEREDSLLLIAQIHDGRWRQRCARTA